MSTAIEFNHVSKQYRLGLVSTKTLSHDLQRWWAMNVLRKEDPYLKIGETNDRSTKGTSDYVWALKDIDFKVEQGDVVGIIGKNGAGKSTLLKLLSKVTGPTTGSIRARGRIGSLLEVGTGFHPEMTGRENIFMNGAILGMSKFEIAKKLDEIVDFSGCERYLDTPVKRYSSGMMVRLGFAVAAHLDPEILVVDEVLAVGDAEFQKKAIGKMQDISKGEGRTVLFVSHNMGAVSRLCKTGVVLSNGNVSFTGNINKTISYYLQNGLELHKSNYVTHSNQTTQVTSARVLNVDGREISQSNNNENIYIEIAIKNLSGRIVRGNFCLYNELEVLILIERIEISNTKNTIYTFIVPTTKLFNGKYFVRFALDIFNECVFEVLNDFLSFEIINVNSPHSKYPDIQNGIIPSFIKTTKKHE